MARRHAGEARRDPPVQLRRRGPRRSPSATAASCRARRSSPAAAAGASRSATATPRSRRRSGASATTSSSPATRSCPASPRTSASTPPSPRPTRSATGSPPAAASRRSPRPGHFALPGHRQPFFGLDIRLADLARHQEEGLDRLEAFLAEPRTATDCFETLFGRRIPRRDLRARPRRGRRPPQPPPRHRPRRTPPGTRTGPGSGSAAIWRLTAAGASRLETLGIPETGDDARGDRHGRARSGQPDRPSPSTSAPSTAFIRFWVYVFGAAILVLIFLAIFNYLSRPRPHRTTSPMRLLP